MSFPLRTVMFLLSSMVLALAPSAGWAADRGLSVNDFQHTTWTARDGVLPDTWAIAQTTDGWLWFGGPNGLTRFDGLRFEKVEVASTDSKLARGIRALYATPDGALLIGHHSGGVSILKDGRFTRFDTEQTRQAGGVVAFAQETDGVIWATAQSGLMRFDGKRWQIIGSDWNFPSGRTGAALMDAHGTFWVGSEKEVLRLLHGGGRFERIDGVCHDPVDLIQSADGQTWCVGMDGVHLVPGQGDPVVGYAAINSRMSYIALFDQKGNFWSSFALDPDARMPTSNVRDVFSLGSVKTILEDREGNIWLGDQAAKVHRLRRPAIARLPNSPLLLDGNAPWTSLAVDKAGNVWMATSGSSPGPTAIDGAWRLDRGLIQRVQADTINSATAIARDKDERIWIGGRQGLWRLEGERFVKAIELPETARGTYMGGLTVNCSGGLWASLIGIGLLRYDGVTWQRNGNVQGLPVGAPLTQGCDPTEHLWLGYGDGTVVRIDDRRATLFSAAQGLQLGAVSAIHAGRRTFVAGERGLAVLVDGRFQTLHTGIAAFDGITGIIESRNGDVWLQGGRGLVHVEAGEIDRAVSTQNFVVAVELFDENDGFPMPVFTAVGAPIHSPVEAGDGRILISGVGGIGSIDPSQVRRRVAPTPLVVRSLTSGGRGFDLVQGIKLPEGTRNLEIAYAALNYSHADRLRFRYRLEGSDADWVDADTRRQAFYTNLGPGTYRFLVNVTNENGLWSESPTSLEFVIPPTFLQSRTFLALCIAGAIGLLALAYRVRVRQLEARQRALLEERLGERERIARELHDTLLQGTQALILRVHLAARDIPADSVSRVKLSEALSSAEEVLAEGRDRIQDLRASHGTLDDLAQTLARVGAELARDTQIDFRVLDEGRPRTLRPGVAEASFSIGREALINAFRHARARSIEVQVTHGDADFRIRVRDDGVGIDPKIAEARSTPGHWGLKGMTERAQKMGARLDLWSRVATGMEVELVVPASVAYQELPARQRWLRRLRLETPAV